MVGVGKDGEANFLEFEVDEYFLEEGAEESFQFLLSSEAVFLLELLENGVGFFLKFLKN